MSKLPVGIQLYGLRDLLEGKSRDFEAVMRQIKEIGYDGVELAGLYGLAPRHVRDVLGEVGLTPVGAHVPLTDLINEAERIAEEYKAVGVDYMVVPYLPEEYRPNTPGYAAALSEIERIGTVMRNNGLKLLYHNHDFEFVTVDEGIFGLDHIFNNIAPELLMVELDTCWVEVAGQSAVEYIRKYAARCEVVHLKDYILEGNPHNLYKLIGAETDATDGGQGLFEFRPIGFGNMLWEPILEAAINVGSKWVVVEQDESYDLGSLEAARRSRDYLKILGW